MESLLGKRKYLFEAEDDETDSNEGDTSTDNADDTSGDEDATSDTSNEEENNEDQNTDDEDYSIDADPDENTDADDTSGDEEDSTDTEGDDTSSDNNIDGGDSEESSPMDQQMFDSLNEDEKQRKIYTLKKMYVDLYSKCDSLIEKFNQISDEDDDNMNPVVKRILKVLYDLKEYISYYLLNSFNKKSYIENDITFSRYLSILNGIKLIVEELQKSQEDDK